MLLNRLPSLLHKFYDSPSKSNPRLAGGFFMGGVRAEWRVLFAYPPYDENGVVCRAGKRSRTRRSGFLDLVQKQRRYKGIYTRAVNRFRSP